MEWILLGTWFLLIIAGLYFVFPKAGRKSWEALVPVYNMVVWLKVIQKPWWWIFLLIFPGVNILMISIMSVNTGTVFAKQEPSDVAKFGFFPFIFLFLLGREENLKYVGPIDRAKFKKTQAQEWRDAILFAVVAASIIRTYFMEAFMIPTSSMEKSLLRGDFLFVSKAAYGPKIPQTPLAFPFFHHSFPLTNGTVKSYTDWIKLPYYRLPGLGTIERNDVVVFNYPAGDTVDTDLQSTVNFTQLVMQNANIYRIQDYLSKGKIKSDKVYEDRARKQLIRNNSLTIRPVDKKEHFIKRCVAIAGDEVSIKNKQLFVNGEAAENPEGLQYNYIVETENGRLTNARTEGNATNAQMMFKDQYNIDVEDQNNGKKLGGGKYILPMSQATAGEMSQDATIKSVTPLIDEKDTLNTSSLHDALYMFGNDQASAMRYLNGYQYKYNDLYPNRFIYPNTRSVDWTQDNYGPIWVPKSGESIALNDQNYTVYYRVITAYEHNTLERKEDGIYLNGEKASEYTFKMNYYWLMGDNRHSSQDSRFWGFVPEDHVVGKASMVWFSFDKERGLFDGKIRWDRLFTVVD